jgi:RimJ/RimL family protein N-acetyltransferase
MVKLEPFTKADFDKLISWVNSEEILVQFAGPIFTFPLTHQQLEQYLEDKNRFVYKVVHLPTNTSIGHAEISLSDESTAILCRILIGDPIYRGQGLGQKIVNKLLEISFTQFAAEKAELNVFDWNVSAIKCYEKAGFVINPNKTKKRDVNGETWTALNMTIDKGQWKSLQ